MSALLPSLGRLSLLQPARVVATSQKWQGSKLFNYTDIAMAAVKKHADALEYVPEDVYDYFEIAKVAVQSNGNALEFVNGEIWGSWKDGNAPYVVDNDYRDLAKLAVQENGDALKWADSTWINDYDEIARIAAAQIYGKVLEHIVNAKEYRKLVKLAVQKNGHMCSSLCTFGSTTTARSPSSPCKSTAKRCNTCP